MDGRHPVSTSSRAKPQTTLAAGVRNSGLLPQKVTTQKVVSGEKTTGKLRA